jgi:general secretion pathway protein G
MLLNKLFRQTRRAQRGMSLIEIMVVVTILGLVAGAIAVAVIPQLGEAKRKTAKTEIARIEQALDLYHVSKGRYPGTDEGLEGLVTEKKLKRLQKDPWGNDYVYMYPGVKNTDSFDIVSYGEDGKPGGAGEAEDISN